MALRPIVRVFQERPKIRSLVPGTNLAVSRFPNATISGGFGGIRAGYDIAFQCPHAVPMVLMFTAHPSRDGVILSDQSMHLSPGVDARDFDPLATSARGLLPYPGCSKSAASLSSNRWY
jgi:hypothetical protein